MAIVWVTLLAARPGERPLVPERPTDLTPPTVTLLSPNGGEAWTAGTGHAIAWTATDAEGILSVDIYYRDGEAAAWTPLMMGTAHTGSEIWYVPNVPTAAARVRVVARDLSGNLGEDQSNATFTIVRQPGGVIATTLRDFFQPGTQPTGGGTFEPHEYCMSCHGYYNPEIEPAHTFLGSMMSQSARDPLYLAAHAITEQDVPSSGELCNRCHAPIGWLAGRGQPTDGSQLMSVDLDGVTCDFCHRLVDPIYQEGVSVPQDQAVINALLPAHRPNSYGNAQFVADPSGVRRGPWTDPVTPHEWYASSFLTSATYCGTCHDSSNPVFRRVSGPTYAPGPLDAPATSINSSVLFPLGRTYSEWKNSAYPNGVYAPDLAGAKPDGMVSSCTDCHLADAVGVACADVGVPIRPDVGVHDLTGGSSWLANAIGLLYPEIDWWALSDGALRTDARLQKAAVVGVTVQPSGGGALAAVTVTNRAGHKLPTGFPEGRRLWLNVTARDAGGAVVYESGAYDPATGALGAGRVYEARLGVSSRLAATTGVAAGPSFRFMLADSVYFDNRIPPLGFWNANYAAFGGGHVDPGGPSPRYPDGQNWDTVTYPLPATARTVVARLYYQSASREYVEFLRDQNHTNAAGQTMYDLWAQNGRSTPVLMDADSASVPLDAASAPVVALALAPASNPFRGALELRLDLDRASPVVLEVFDLNGRRVARHDLGRLEAGTRRLAWDGRDAGGEDAGAGAFWARVTAGDRRLVRQVVRLR